METAYWNPLSLRRLLVVPISYWKTFVPPLLRTAGLAVFMLFCVLASVLPAFAQRPAVAPQGGVVVQNLSHPPSYGVALGGSTFYEYIDDFTITVNAASKTVTLRIAVVITTGEEANYGAGEYVNAWVDFNGNGVFDIGSEQVMDHLQFASAVGFKGTLVYTVTVAIPEDAVDFTWGRAVLGYGFDPGPTGAWTWGNSMTNPTSLGIDFNVVSHRPEANKEGVDFNSPTIEVTFNKPYEQSTLTTNSIYIEYRNAGGSFVKVKGTIQHVSGTKARFVPNAALMDAVYYRVTVKGGAGGVTDRDDPGDPLQNDAYWWFATLVNPTVEVHTFQVARNAQLVPNKPAMVRVYSKWEEKNDVYPADQVKSYWAKMSVEAGGGNLLAPKDNILIMRPDQYTAAEKRKANNSVNFFNWTPTSANGNQIKAVVEQKNQDQSPARTFDGIRALSYSNESPRLKTLYYFVKVGAWTGGVPPASRTSGLGTLTGGATFTTQNFPILSVNLENGGTLNITPPGSIVTKVEDGVNVNYYRIEVTLGPVTIYKYNIRVDKYVVQKLKEAAEAAGSDADFITGIIPQGFQNGFTGVAWMNYDVLLLVQGSANTGTVAHEIGHIFGLSPTASGHDNDDTGIEGFKLLLNGSEGYNKSFTEGNGEFGFIEPLMHTTIQPPGSQFIDNGEYNHLFGTVKNVAQPDALLAVLGTDAIATAMADGEYYVITGFVSANETTAGFNPVKVLELPPPPPPISGDFTLELLDTNGDVVNSTTFNLINPKVLHGPPLVEGDEAFAVMLPYDPAVQKIVVKKGDNVLGELERSANAPAIAFTSPTEGETWSGAQTVMWTSTDDDADLVYYTLFYSPDGGTVVAQRELEFSVL